MKQGSGNSQSGDQKREPIAKAVNVSSVAEIGVIEVHIGGSSSALYTGRGYEAPLAGSDTHRSGSQGKH